MKTVNDIICKINDVKRSITILENRRTNETDNIGDVIDHLMDYIDMLGSLKVEVIRK